ncbi:MAG: Helix-turn-helix domain protein [Syntrophorhabdaceae bacterium PtaU1.Bin034]|nr:MAG: Helix-turn-helix domain protein [Syntrophorhabdaceae bacterium PtaU1.Bin034]
MISMDELIPLIEAAKILRISRVTLWKWMKQGRIAVVRLSERKVCIEKTELERFIAENRMRGGQGQ